MADKNLKLSLQITADLNNAKRDIDGLNQSLNNTRSAASNASSASTVANQIAVSAQEAAASIRQIDDAADLSFGVNQFDQYGGVVEDVSGILAGATQQAESLNQSADQVLPSLAALAATVGGLGLGIGLVDAIDEWGQYDVRIKMAAKSEADYILVKQRLLETANNTFRPLAEAQELYIKTSQSLKDLGYNTNQALDITDSFSYLLVTNAASADKAQSALDAYSKSINKNKVEADAWESIATAMPTIVGAIATATGKTEAEIRTLGVEGTLSLQDLNEGFRKTVATNKELAAAMDVTRKDSVTALKNEFINLLGEFNKNWQVTQALSGGISLLAENIDLVTGATAVLISFALTKYLASAAIAAGQNAIAVYQQITATGAAVAADRVRTASILVLANANAAATGSELANAEAALIQAQANTAGTVTATQLAAAEVRVATATLAHTEATVAQTLAQRANATAMAGSALTAKALGGALLGPVGLAITVATVAAGFLLMSDSSDEVTDSLDGQAKSVADLAAEYIKLNEAQRRQLTRDAVKNVDELTVAYKNANMELDYRARIAAKVADSGESAQIKQLVEDFKDQKITADALSNALAKMTSVSDGYKKEVDAASIAVNNQRDKLDRGQQILDVYTGKTDAAKVAANSLTQNLNAQGNAADGVAAGLKTVNKELDDYIKKAGEDIFNNTMQTNLINKGYSPAQSKALTDARNAKGSDLTAGDAQVALEVVKASDALTQVTQARQKAEEKITKEKENQQKIAEQTAAINKRVLAQSKQFNYAGLEQANKLPSGLLAAISMQESRGNPNAYNKDSGATGAFQFMAPTAGQYGLKDRKDVQASAQAAAKYLAYLLKLFKGDLDKAIMAYNAGEGNVQSGKAYSFKETKAYLPSVKRYMAGANGLSSIDAQQDLAAMVKANEDTNNAAREASIKLAEDQLNIRKDYFNDDEKFAFEHQEKIKQINKAGFAEAERDALIARENIEFAAIKDPKLNEALKRIKESVPQLQNDLLKAQGNELEAQLAAIEAKWKPLQDDLALAASKTENPFQKAQFLKSSIDLEVVIDKEKIQVQLNDAMQQIQDMQSLRTLRLDNLKVQFDSGQISQPQYADQARQIDAELKPRLTELVTLATQYADKMGGAEGAKIKENLNATTLAMTQANNELRKFLPTADQLNDRIAGGLTDAIMAFADGTKSAGDAFRQFASTFLLEIAQMIIKQMIFNAIGGASKGGGTGGAIAGLIGAAFGAGYASGGYTGNGGKYEPKGIVHGGEVVINKAVVSQPGMKDFLLDVNQRGFDALSRFKGYADGGLVTPSVQPRVISPSKLADPAAAIAASTSFTSNQQFLLVDDPSRLTDYIKSGKGQETLVVMMSRDPAKFRAALKVGG